jgi:hypothetical protein
MVPKEFLEHVLPAILRASETFVYDQKDELRPDRIWLQRRLSPHDRGIPEGVRNCI